MADRAEEQWSLPTRLRISVENQEKAAEEQELWRQKANSPFAALTPEEFERSRAAIAVEEIERTLRDISDEVNKVRYRDAAQTEEWLGTKEVLKERLAENYATLGRYDKAARLTKDEAKRAEYTAILDAIHRDDSKWCECGRAGGDTPVTNVYVKQDIWSHKHRRFMPLLACRECGMMNVAPMPEDVAQMRAARARAITLVGNAKPGEARKILQANNHALTQILKR